MRECVSGVYFPTRDDVRLTIKHFHARLPILLLMGEERPGKFSVSVSKCEEKRPENTAPFSRLETTVGGK